MSSGKAAGALRQAGLVRQLEGAGKGGEIGRVGGIVGERVVEGGHGRIGRRRGSVVHGTLR